VPTSTGRRGEIILKTEKKIIRVTRISLSKLSMVINRFYLDLSSKAIPGGLYALLELS